MHFCLSSGTVLSIDDVHAHWHQRSAEIQQRAYRAFLSIPTPRTTVHASVSNARSAADFFAESMAALRPLAEAGNDDRKLGVLKMHALDLYQHLANGAPLKIADAKSRNNLYDFTIWQEWKI